MSETIAHEIRDELVQYLERTLQGPSDGPTEVLGTPPHQRYLFGTLYPQRATSEQRFAGELTDGNEPTESEEDPINLASQWMPSSLGISFYLAGNGSVQVEIEAGRYVDEGDKRARAWVREPLGPEIVALTPLVREKVLFGGAAKVVSRWRPFRDGNLVTVSVVNPREQAEESVDVDPISCLFQVALSVKAVDGARFEDYPRYDLLVADNEDEELQLLYRKRKAFAIGHGCSAEWDLDNDNVSRVWAALIPKSEVKPITTRIPLRHARLLHLSYLADIHLPTSELFEALRGFVAEYRLWIDGLPGEHPDIPSRLESAKARILGRLGIAATRMSDGIDALESDPQALEAFRFANLAMVMQMVHGASEHAGTRRKRGTVTAVRPDYLAGSHSWRPFQLAFLLLSARSIVQESHSDRDIVDLIWFPTGGGKTEAYLFVAAFQIFLRRLRNPVIGQGTTVITRYTLRLLTTQQFQRASALVCACEVLRRKQSNLGGPITIGLWVGQSGSPNTCRDAYDRYIALREGREEDNPFQVDACPWCGTEIVPGQPSDDDADYGIRCTNTRFEFFCPNSACEFHEKLPINVVDQALYAEPPTFLIATVDKFARLTWESAGGVFFGQGGYQPPSLVIQDELHLISGPLGTIAGLYEAAIGALMSMNGARPKIVASTATIRRADQQVKALFGREVHVFPPAGLVEDNSYFSRTDRESPGRLYVGLMAPSHSSTTAQVDCTAAILQAPIELGLQGKELDAYWTLVAYHNSLKELGKTTTLLRDDVPLRVESIALNQSVTRTLPDDSIESLTSESPNTLEILRRLTLPWDDPASLGVLACTNMLSVGIDVSRLALMMVIGQPKTCTEYIQATSRVGRASIPGLVFVLLRPTKPRDRSHYEAFKSFHQALYRFVEPTSVTPFSAPARDRALHAALVILMRHGAGLVQNDAAMRFDPNSPPEAAALTALRERVKFVDQAEEAATNLKLDLLVAEWLERKRAATAAGRPLQYQGGRQFETLLKRFGERKNGWETLDSMRNVDAECGVRVWGEKP